MGIVNFFKSRKAPTEIDPFADGNSCLQMIRDSWDVQNVDRYAVFAKVLESAKKYSDPSHLLACAYACHYSTADFRPEAIFYFENYLKNPIPPADQIFSLVQVYTDLAKDYEGEYDFNKAEECYIKAIRLRPARLYNSHSGQYDLFPQEVMLGRLYLKISTEKALEYWRSLMSQNEYVFGDSECSGFRRQVDVEYKNALEKHNKVYVYRPRKKQV